MIHLITLLLACTPDKGSPTDTGLDPYDVPVGPYAADIRWTSHGIPHIQADSYGSLGFGMGYAFARDHACVLADQVVRVRSERSRWFGEAYLDADLGWKALGVRQQAEDGWFEIEPEVQEMLVGYAAGYNRWLETGTLDERCAGQEWVQPITHIDLLSYYLALGLVGSGGVFVDAVGSAAPPTVAGASNVQRAPPPPLDLFAPILEPGMGSNGWAIGADRSESGGGLLLSNTHFPAEGERKWHESHLTIPGVLDVYGASLMGVATINLGFNQSVAWTHTVSMAPRFTMALLELDPADPTRYLYEGEYLDMKQVKVEAEVLQADGSLLTVERTLYESRWGPVINAPVLGWNELYAVSLTDANRNNLAMLGAWFDMNRASNLDEFEAVHRDKGGIPWVHTMAADSTGETLYIDSSSVPNWSQEAEARYPEWLSEQPLAELFDGYGVYTADGSDDTFDWVEEEGAWMPGLVPFEKMPRLRRTDFVFNSNDNHWLSNPEQPLEGYPMLYGSERTARDPRTRMNARYLAELGESSASGADNRFSLEEVEAAALGGRGILAEELLAEVVERCSSLTTVDRDGQEVDVQPACQALAAWDGTVTTQQVGPPVWREMLGSGVFATEDLFQAGGLMSVDFDADSPVDTPTGLAEEALIDQALAQAVLNLDAAGLDPGQTLGEAQFLAKQGQPLPMPGGSFYEGTIAIASWSGGNATLLQTEERGEVINETSDLTVGGYQMNYGNSFVLAVELGASGPRARAIMVYSQSDDPTSPYYQDQSELYPTEGMRDVAFTEEEITAALVESLTLTLD